MTLLPSINHTRAPARLLMVSNRAPIEHHVDRDGALSVREGCGGVATALSAAAGDVSLRWIASAATPADRWLACTGQAVDLEDGTRLRLIAPPADSYELFYRTFCNPILWFLQHSPLWKRYDRDIEAKAARAWSSGYVPVNKAFARAVIEELRAEREPLPVMLHDYHLYLAPGFIREFRPDAVLQQFIHIPWPEPQIWELLPAAMVRSICAGLLANDSVVFQTKAHAQHFLHTCEAFLPEARAGRDAVIHRRRRTSVWVNPISVDVFRLRAQLSSSKALTLLGRFEPPPDMRTIVRVDRLDPSKNIIAGFRAYQRLLESHPEWRGRVRLLAFLVPSRREIPEYRHYANAVFALVSNINDRYGDDGWQPITVFHEHDRLQALAAMTHYDVLLVNPIADGMNLVAKEGPAVNRRDGVLVLSTAAGAYDELKQGALPVHPGDVGQTAGALHAALSMSAEERGERASRLRQAIGRHDLSRWLNLLIDDLTAITMSKESAPTRSSVLSRA